VELPFSGLLAGDGVGWSSSRVSPPAVNSFGCDVGVTLRPLPVVAICDLPPPGQTSAMAHPRHAGHRRVMNAQMADRAQIESDWDLVAQSAPEFEADQRISW